LSNLLILPIAVPLVTASFCLMAWNRPTFQRYLSMIGAVTHLLMTFLVFNEVKERGVLALQSGGWPAPFGITIAADSLSAVMLILAGIVGTIIVFHSQGSIDRARVAFGFHPLVHVLLLGVSGAFMTVDFFNLFVWFEVLLISSFVLMALGGEKPQLQGSFKYVAINLVASAVFLSALGLLYGTLGTLNMAHAALLADQVEEPGFMVAVAMLFIVSFSIKAGLFPFYFWLPASYHTPPIAVSALFAGLLTKVGVYALLRSFSLVFTAHTALLSEVLIWLASITMVLGGLGAIVQKDIRRVISFNMLTGIGAMVLGVALVTQEAYAAAVLYIIHSALVTTALFLLAGLVRERSGSYDITQMGGLYVQQPRLALGFFAVALAMAGLPPLSGFFPKVALMEISLERSSYWPVAAVVVSSLLALVSFIRVWAWGFWSSGQPAQVRTKDIAYGACFVAAVLAVALPVVMGPLQNLADSVGHSLMQRQAYIDVILPEVPR
jgi:multicomponent Na+:H+ antiporter subunit D